MKETSVSLIRIFEYLGRDSEKTKTETKSLFSSANEKVGKKDIFEETTSPKNR